MTEQPLPPSLSGTVRSVCTSTLKGTQKQGVPEGMLVPASGLQGDAHAGPWHRQVSLLSNEDIDTMRKAGLDLSPGAFGENIVSEGIDLLGLAVGRRFRIGNEAVLQVTQHGKTCHRRCQIYYRAGDCIMPKRGIFARVLRGGVVRAGDAITTHSSLDRPRYAVAWLTDHTTTTHEQHEALVDAVCAPSRGAIVATWRLAPDTVDWGATLRQLANAAIVDVVFVVCEASSYPIYEHNDSEPSLVVKRIADGCRAALTDSIRRWEAQSAAAASAASYA